VLAGAFIAPASGLTPIKKLTVPKMFIKTNFHQLRLSKALTLSFLPYITPQITSQPFHMKFNQILSFSLVRETFVCEVSLFFSLAKIDFS
jgi:hypothetical protein